MSIKRIIVLFVFSIISLMNGLQLRAQFNDPINTAVNAHHSATATVDAYSQFLAMLDQFDLGQEQLDGLKAWKEKIDEWNSNLQMAKDFLDKFQDYYTLYNLLMSQIRSLETYAKCIQSTATQKFNQYYLSSLLNYATNVGYTIQQIFDTIEIIRNEDGIDKAQRQMMIDDITEEGVRKLKHTQAKINDELAFLMNMSEVVPLLNFMMGREPNEGLDCLGAETSYVDNSSSTTTPSVGTGDYIDASEIGGTVGATLYKIILIIIGISCLGSLIFAFAKYVRGAYESEMTFIRIFSVIVIVLIIFSIISKLVF